MEFGLFTSDGMYHLLRWFHTMAGVAWIGLLYYFNFVQGPFFAETDAATKSGAIQKLVPRALFWFRYSALATAVLGLLMLGMRGHGSPGLFETSWGVFILVGGVFGLLMAANVWFIIWPNQKIVIASAVQAAAGKGPIAEAAAAGARAGVASRTNVLFSIPMLFFMGAASHLPLNMGPMNYSGLAIVLAVVMGLLELNAIKGKTGPMTSVPGVIHCGLGLLAVVYAIIEIMI